MRAWGAAGLLLWAGFAGADDVLWEDGFADVAAWSAHPASDVEMSLHADPAMPPVADAPSSLRVDFSFPGAGWAIARRDVGVDLPDNYAFSFWIRGECMPQTVEFKLIDASGENVWWSVRRDFEFSGDWQRLTVKKRHVAFAWGPAGGGEIGHVAAIEIAITASSGGAGRVWIGDLQLRELPRSDATPPTPRAIASSVAAGSAPEAVIDGDVSTAWSPPRDDASPWLALDLGALRELGGATLDWSEATESLDYDVEISDDGQTWRTRETVRGSNGGRDWLYLPETNARWLRVSLRSPAPPLAEIALHPVDWAPRREDFFARIAAEAPRGTYPRSYVGEQVYWTVVGVDADDAESLFSEDGAIELGPWQPTLEPFLTVGDSLVGWADAKIGNYADSAGASGSVRWASDVFDLFLRVEAIGGPGASSLLVRYSLSQIGVAPVVLHLAIRPFQVNPPTQFLNRPGGCAPIQRLRLDEQTVFVNDRPAVMLIDAPARMGASSFYGGDVVADYLNQAKWPASLEVDDPFGGASGVISFSEPEVTVILPLHAKSPLPDRDDVLAWIQEQRELAEPARNAEGREGIELVLPPSSAWLSGTLQRQLAYLRINRDGPALQPGSRSYARSWIRDGALSASALLRAGHPEIAREFLDWYAPHQFSDGKVPCVVDARGADPVPEHDSSGEFIFLVAELLRYTGDDAEAERQWPRVERAAAYLDSLRQLRRTDEYREVSGGAFFGLLPESISHEGYSAKPMHSYWDDFWALRGFADVAWLAGQLHFDTEAARWQAVHDEFARDLSRSVETAMTLHGIDYVPGCADLGDFDATSTTIALAPTGAAAILPTDAVVATFEKYWEFFVERRESDEWDAFTPYELRNVGAFVRLGWRDRALELLDWFRRYQRPGGWLQWAEVVARDQRQPRFLGDMPHTWVGSDFVRSVLDMFCYVDPATETMVLAAGVSRAWIQSPEGLELRGLSTPYGPLRMSVRGARPHAWTVEVGGDLHMPPGGIRLDLPLDEPPQSVEIDGQAVELAVPLWLDHVPATIVIRP